MRNARRIPKSSKASFEPGVRIERHEGALVGSVTLRLDSPYEQALLLVKTKMKQIANAVDSAGGLIGHIKFHLEAAPRSCNLFLTEPGDLQEKSVPDGPSTVQGAVIVFGIMESDFEQMLANAFPDVPWENEFTL